MRNYTLILFLVLCSSNLFSQKYADYKARASENMVYLANGETVSKYFNITDKGIEVYNHPFNHSKPEFTLFYDEVDVFLNMFHDKKHFEMIDFYERKGNNHLRLSEELQVYQYFRWKPESLDGLKIALDPGHMASDMAFAIKERKFVRIQAKEAGTKKDLEFFEADLAYKQAVILKDTLESLGAEVFITRENGKSAVGKDFDKWLVEDYEESVNFLEKNEVYSTNFINKLRNNSSQWEKFKYVYQYFDFVNRAWEINEFDPNLTLILHFNADEKGERYWEEGYWTPSEDNYSMAFIPGSFLDGELIKKDARISFLRLLVSSDLRESERLAGHIMQGHDKELKVSPYPWNEESSMLKNCLPTNEEGVFARNLYMTRAITTSPVCYIESLYQDNIKEAIRLDKKDYTLKDGTKTSSRVAEGAFVDLNAIIQMLEENIILNDATQEYVFIRTGERVEIASRGK